LNKLKLAKDGGFQVYLGTPTKGALAFAKEVIANTVNGTSFTDYQGSSFSPPGDSLAKCRLWGVLLITDGESNFCNPEDGQPGNDPLTDRDNYWRTCSNDPTTNNWNNYPPGKADEIFNLWEVDKSPPRTFAIGLSADVSQCELNWVAYKGRTDASAPLGDGGIKYKSDPRLWDGSTWANFDPSAPYAFFALTPEQFEAAVEAVPASLGTGDYVTGPPSGSPAPSGVGSVGLIASVTYPTWQGHLYAYDISEKIYSAPPYYKLLWDAGQVLSSGNNGEPRKIYTWNPLTKQLILIDDPASDATTLNLLCGGCGITPQVVDFLIGNDGSLSGTKRPWLLGALVNSTPAIIGPPEHWLQSAGLDSQRNAFEADYTNRKWLVWVGASDGMLHAFSLEDGHEVLAIVPPDLLDTQIALYNRYSMDPVRFPMGQPAAADRHIYGVANSVRFGDVYDPSLGTFRTIIYVTDGPGGTGLHALDVTHPSPGDPNYDASKPFQPLFSLTADGEAGTTAVAGLKLTFNVPALGRNEDNQWRLIVGRGYPMKADPGAYTSPQVFFLDALTGAVVDTESLTAKPDAKIYVKEQALADNGLFKHDAKFYRPENAVTLGVQPDLNGQLWVFERNTSNNFTSKMLVDFSDKASSRFVPFYFASAEAAWPTNGPDRDVFALVSGSYYENSWFINPPSTSFNGGFYFRAGMHVAVSKFTAPFSINTASIWFEDQLHDDPDQCPAYFAEHPEAKDCPFREYFSPRSQPTAPPFLFVPEEKIGAQPVHILALVYDPDAEFCHGHTYLVDWKVDPGNLSAPGSVTTYEGGQGASSGLLITPQGNVILAKSWVGQASDGKAYFDIPPAQFQSPGPPAARGILWWREVQ